MVQRKNFRIIVVSLGMMASGLAFQNCSSDPTVITRKPSSLSQETVASVPRTDDVQSVQMRHPQSLLPMGIYETP